MSKLLVKRSVECVVGEAPRLLEVFLARHARGDRAVLALRAPIHVPGLPTMKLERSAVISLHRADVSASMQASYDVSWEAERGGPFPRFVGKLTIANDQDYSACTLVLEGVYTPPLGVAGAAFDAALGHRIAVAVGTDLLDQIGGDLETEYQASEAIKATLREAAVSPRS